jgi:hypothetical protein
MALSDTATAINCLPVCPEARSLSEPQFLLLLIDFLATEAGIDIADITAGNLKTTVDDAYCDLLDRGYLFSASPETLRATALYLAQQLA